MKTTSPGILLLGGVLLAGCHQPTTPPETSDVRVTDGKVTVTPGSPPANSIVVVASAAPTASVLSFNGRLVWDDNVTTRLFTPLAGRVTRIFVEVGARVEAGSPLALIASPDFGQAQADARRAATDLQLAERTLDRERELFEHGAVPQKDVQSAGADVERGLLEKQRTARRLELYGADTNGVDQAYVLRSPIAGIVVEKSINTGAELRADSMLANNDKLAAPQFVITDPERLWVQIDVPERDQARITVGQTVSIQAGNLPGKAFMGRVELIGDALDPATRTVKARGSLANPGRLLKSEMFVKAEVPVEPETGVVVPSRAVYLRGDKHCVIVEANPGCYQRQEVALGAGLGGQTLVTSGLQAGQRVVTDGVLLLEQMLTDAPN